MKSTETYRHNHLWWDAVDEQLVQTLSHFEQAFKQIENLADQVHLDLIFNGVFEAHHAGDCSSTIIEAVFLVYTSQSGLETS